MEDAAGGKLPAGHSLCLAAASWLCVDHSHSHEGTPPPHYGWGNTWSQPLQPGSWAVVLARKETSIVCVWHSLAENVFIFFFPLYLIARNHTSPESCVHKTLPCRLLQLRVKISKCGSWRDAVSVGILTKLTVGHSKSNVSKTLFSLARFLKTTTIYYKCKHKNGLYMRLSHGITFLQKWGKTKTNVTLRTTVCTTTAHWTFTWGGQLSCNLFTLQPFPSNGDPVRSDSGFGLILGGGSLKLTAACPQWLSPLQLQQPWWQSRNPPRTCGLVHSHEHGSLQCLASPPCHPHPTPAITVGLHAK